MIDKQTVIYAGFGNERGDKQIFMRLKEYIQTRRIVADGAFGTYYMSLYGDGSKPEKGLAVSNLPEHANKEAPERVVDIHTEYIEAGARFIRTNTFASNTKSLSDDIATVKENIRAAVICAKTAAEKAEREIYIVGDIGPIPVEGVPHSDNLTQEYISIGKTFIEQGIDILLFETFPELETILPAITYLKETYDCTILVHFSVNQFGYSNTGLSAKRLITDAKACRYIDGTGLNCGVGPGHMKKLIQKISADTDTFLSVFPNSGYPKYLNNRLTFTDNAEYFAEKMTEIAGSGICIFGGCCGTTPDYIRKIAAGISPDYPVDSRKMIVEEAAASEKPAYGFMERRMEDPSHKLIAVELVPPLNADDEKLLDAAYILKNAQVDVVTFPDSPSGRTRADSVLMAEKIRLETGLCVMPHICCRDKNAIAIRSTILGASLNHIKNFLLLTGDPVPVLFRQTTKSVFNFDSVGMMKIVQEMNSDTFTGYPVTYGGAINHNRMNTKAETERIRRKMTAGATFFMTQPIFSAEQAEIIRQMKKETGATILVGLMPLVSRKNAIFMKNEMTGIEIPDSVIDRYREDMSREEGENCGIQLAGEFMEMTDDFADGYYFSFPFNRVHMLKKILCKI